MKVQFVITIIFITFLKYQPQCHAQGHASSTTNATISQFAWKLFRSLKPPSKDAENLVLSPITVQLLLSVLQYAAEGASKEQIQLVTDHVNPTQLYYILNPVGIAPQVKSANGIFIDSNDNVNENASLHIYVNGGDIYNVPLQNDPAKAKLIINNWASNATAGHIPKILTDGSDVSSLRALLVSAIYFHSTWKHQLRPSQPRYFYTLFSGAILTDYMEVNAYFKTKQVDLGATNWGTVINLPYKESRYSMFLIVPGHETTLKRFLASLGNTKFSEIVKNPSQLSSTKLKLFLPKFKITSKTSLVSALQKMGLVDIFSPSKSRLTKLLDGNEALRINEILQQSTLDVDEFGSTATSVTTAFVVPLSAAEPEPKILVIDMPFLAVIVETVNETPIFIARITNPAGYS